MLGSLLPDANFSRIHRHSHSASVLETNYHLQPLLSAMCVCVANNLQNSPQQHAQSLQRIRVGQQDLEQEGAEVNNVESAHFMARARCVDALIVSLNKVV